MPTRLHSAALAVLVALAAACGPEPRAPGPDPRAPGPRPLESDAQMVEFLADSRFSEVGDTADWWRFENDGAYEAQLDGRTTSGRWDASETSLVLTAEDGSTRHELPLRWLDGKLNIEIDGVQYRRREWRLR